MEEYNKLLKQNKDWAQSQTEKDPDFFKRLVNLQTPHFLWIGCSDSRVPANEITNTQPGEIFVHRNIANLVISTDLNFLSVLKYAVEILKVKHIIVTGHYGCGGIAASMSNINFGLLNKWLRPIKDVYFKYQKELEIITNEQKRAERLVELNTIEQVRNLAKISTVQKSWANSEFPVLHGCVYSLENGVIKHLITIDSKTELPAIYRFDFKQEETEDN